MHIKLQNKNLTFHVCPSPLTSDLLNCSASGVDDAVGEVSLTVEIFSDPNTGGHKITVKGASVFRICVTPLCIDVMLMRLLCCD